MMNTVYYKLWIVLAIIVIDLMQDQVSAKSQKAIDKETRNRDALAQKIQIIIYKGQSIGTAKQTCVPITQPDVLYDNIDPYKPLVIYVHGFREGPSAENTQTVVGAHLQRGQDNIWSFDWSKLSFYGYGKVVKNAKIIAQIFAIALTKLIDLGLNIDNCHIVSHSLGSQISGLVWKYFDYILPRITALDPAGPGFSHSRDEHIDNRSARFVDIIHTDRGYYGYEENTGTADFYPNDGKRPQPGCPRGGPLLSPTDLCSHWRSWRYYAESVIDVNAFPATLCDNFQNYLKGECSDNPVVNMGYGAPSYACGEYYLTTRDAFPYGENYSD
ncbi:hypothetical protein PV327_003782 [Microctonus hyperodae]|uniref:phospholipase A1 n=1 Tax=Microctonus hyperodae TaxID=165561 RepID=A0AA39G529_MICHY|nr:hypothetical protein PV327_003782 [Microctonus hyperodae]